MVAANTRVETKNLNGFVAETSMASICSVTRIEPNSAPMLDPTFPAAISPVNSGANVLSKAIATSEGSQEVAPNSDREGLLCFVKTIPVINPVVEINSNDLYPIL